MKKLFLYAGILLATFAMVACNEDFDDWASPQAYNQEDDANTYGLNVSAGSDAVIVMNDETPEYVAIVSVAADNANIASCKLNSLSILGTPIAATLEDGKVMVRAAELDSLIEAKTLDRSATAHEVDVVTEFSAILTTGEGAPVKATTKVSLTPAGTPEIDEAGYALLGDFQGWNPGSPIWMTQTEAGVYQAEVVVTKDGDNWFKFYKGSGFGEGDFTWDAVAMGCAVNGDNSPVNLLVWGNDPIYGGFQTPVITGAGTYIITLDMNKGMYKFEPVEKKYYVVGTPNGWSDSSRTCLFYAHGGNVYSYATNWANQWSLKIWDEDNFGVWDVAYGAAADGATDATGSLVNSGAGAFGPAAEGGLYILTINMASKTYEWTAVENPVDYETIGIIGGFSDWSSDVDMTQLESAPHNWTASVSFDSPTEVKFRANHGWDINWGSDKSAEINADTYYVKPGGDNIVIGEAGTYDFYFNDITGRFSIVKQ